MKKKGPCKNAAFYIKNAASLQLYNCKKAVSKKAASLHKMLLFYKYIIDSVRKLLSYVKILYFYNYIFVKKAAFLQKYLFVESNSFDKYSIRK